MTSISQLYIITAAVAMTLLLAIHMTAASPNLCTECVYSLAMVRKFCSPEPVCAGSLCTEGYACELLQDSTAWTQYILSYVAETS